MNYKLRNSMTFRLLQCFLIAVCLLLGGCGSIKRFSVSPYNVCPGETVSAIWVVSDGDVFLEANKNLEGLGPQSQLGQKNFSVNSNTTFILKAKDIFKTDQSEVEVTVLPATYTKTFGEIASCKDNAQPVSLSLFISGETISPKSHPLIITNPYPHIIIISKDGIEAVLPPKEKTDKFKDISIVGTWYVRAPIEVNETCNSALNAVGNRLTFRTQLSCGR